MKEKKFIIIIDILGYEILAQEIAAKSGYDESLIRERDIKKPLRHKIEQIKRQGNKLSEKIMISKGNDDYTIFVDEIDKVFEIINAVCSIRIPQKECGNIPVSIVVDMKEIDITAEEPMSFRESIRLMKDELCEQFKTSFKKKYNVKTVKQTFIVLTQFVYNVLKEYQKNQCEFFETVSFCSLPLEAVEREYKISDFLKKINQPKIDYSGALIDKIFIKPDEYDDILNRLKNERIVFITGAPGYGKTYSAIRLLWEWYCNGYTPRWCSGKEPAQREAVREKLINIEVELKPKYIIYFEDPFGKTKFEKSEHLKERISSVITSVKNKEDAYAIITSRKDVFEEFEKESLSVEQIKLFEKELNILTPSYGYEKRKEILRKWTEENQCEWIKNDELKEFVYRSLDYEGTLLTPLSIHDFTQATKKTNNKNELSEKINAYSAAVEKAFADEIIGLYESGRKDRLLFLSFIFISEEFNIDYIKTYYEELSESNYENYDVVLKEEYRVRIHETTIEFNHSSYLNALPHILKHRGFNDIFCRVLDFLLGDSQRCHLSLNAIARNFYNLPERIKMQLLKFAENDNTAFGVAYSLKNNFVILPETLRNNLLSMTVKRPNTSDDLSAVLLHNFSLIGADLRNNLLMELANKKEVSSEYEEVVARHFLEIPDNFRDRILTKFSRNASSLSALANILNYHYIQIDGMLRNDFLHIIFNNGNFFEILQEIMTDNFENFPEDIRNQLLANFSRQEENDLWLNSAIGDNFNLIPDKIRKELLTKVVNNNDAYVLRKNFIKITPDSRNTLIYKLLKNPMHGWGVSYLLLEHFKSLPSDITDNIFKFSENPETIASVSSALALYYNNIPETTRNNLLLTLSKHHFSASGVAYIISDHIKNIPALISNILYDIANNENCVSDVAYAISENFNKFPEKFRDDLISKIADNNASIWGLAHLAMVNYNKLSAPLKSKILAKISEIKNAVGIDFGFNEVNISNKKTNTKRTRNKTKRAGK